MLGNNRDAKIDGDGNVVIQNSDNSSITINLNNPKEVRRGLMNLQHEMNTLPLKIIQELMKHNDSKVPAVGANIYLSLNIMFETIGNRPTGNILGISFGVSVTNTNKEHRYFYEPSFKVSTPFDNGLDTFVMTDKHPDNPVFPRRLEYGEPFTVYYNISDMKLFKELVERDDNASITAIVNTTLGEVFCSNECKLKELLEDERLVHPAPKG